ncbi:MAG TPA: DUF1345 domain-containing protein [Rhizomicrobium sp.]|jgi:uncharacterized membrane protein|nr:DUF1345 domain-containing protein [Rhizomicrobium sp.]
MSSLAARHWHHHAKFYLSLAAGGAALAVAYALRLKMPMAIAGDTVFTVYICAFVEALPRLKPDALKQRAKVEDEGAFLVSLIIVAVIAQTCGAIFATLNDKKSVEPLWLAVTLAGAPLGWVVIQLNEALHYSNIHYARHGGARKSGDDLEFPGTPDPGIWDFLYFSFVVGTTAQTSDVEVRSTEMRRAVTLHSIVSFFFNTILIAMAVNAVVSRAA